MKKLMILMLFVVVVASVAMAAQGVTASSKPTSTGAAGAAVPTVDVLGAHNNYGRGCAGCHAPHSGAAGAGGNGIGGTVIDPYTGANALFAQDMGPLFGTTLDFSDLNPTSTAAGKYQFVVPAGLSTANTQQYSDLRGIVMCLACHDGAVAKGAMMQNWAYEQQIGALPTSYGTGKIPTLLGNDGSSSAYHNDHPVGENATIAAAGAGVTYTLSGTAPNQAITAITANASYQTFMNSYGAPAIMKGAHSYPTPVNATGNPYVVCTTCHNQHVMNIYASSTANQIALDGGGKTYATYFFVNGPYNVNNVATVTNPALAPSTTQFCRQCHFGEANESNGGSFPTAF
jgi:cytochrome c553